jgi:hypothetical protein
MKFSVSGTNGDIDDDVNAGEPGAAAGGWDLTEKNR